MNDLHTQALEGKLSLITKLLQNGYKINTKDHLGRTALFYALNEEVALLLLHYKIDWKIRDIDGKTASDINPYVNYVVNQRCNESKKNILKFLTG